MNQTLCTSVLALIALIWAGSSTAQVRDQEGCTRDYSFTGNQAVIRWQLTDEERARTDTRELAREIFDQKYPNGGAVAQSYAIHFIEVPNAIPPVTRAVLYICVELAPIASASNPATSPTSTSISTAIPSTRPTLHDGGILQSSELEGVSSYIGVNAEAISESTCVKFSNTSILKMLSDYEWGASITATLDNPAFQMCASWAYDYFYGCQSYHQISVLDPENGLPILTSTNLEFKMICVEPLEETEADWFLEINTTPDQDSP